MRTVFCSLMIVVVFLTFNATAGIPNPDVNLDGNVDWVDFCVVMGVAIFEPPLQAKNADINQDGIIDEKDLIIIRDYPGFDIEKELISHENEINYLIFTKRFPGDIDQNGLVNVIDLTIISRKYGELVAEKTPEDLNGDRIIGRADLDLAVPLFGKTYFIFSHQILPVGKGVKSFTAPLLQKIGFAVKSKDKVIATWGSLRKGDPK